MGLTQLELALALRDYLPAWHPGCSARLVRYLEANVYYASGHLADALHKVLGVRPPLPRRLPEFTGEGRRRAKQARKRQWRQEHARSSTVVAMPRLVPTLTPPRW